MAAGSGAKRISGMAYQALRSALACVYWYKSSLGKYLRTTLREHPEILNGVDFGAMKREIADEVVDRLMRDECRYQHTTLTMMVELANLERFPELEQHEDSKKWLPKAQVAVAELKRCTKSFEYLLSDQEKHAAERLAYTRQVEIQHRFADELQALRNEFFSLAAASDHQQRGRDFEHFLNSLFALFDLEPRLSYSLETEQIDGSFSFDTDDYILEAKWTKLPVGREQADAFAKKVERKGKNALGLIVSVNGISEATRQTYREGTPFMTLDGTDLMCVLEQRAKLDDVLRRKKRHANDTGQCYFPAREMFEA